MDEETRGPSAPHRVAAIDRLRGLIMALMAVDHTRDFFLGFLPDPTDLDTTTPALFATRWITHICAPGFLLLAGLSAWLNGRGRSRRSLSFFLAIRGAFLVVLELTVVTFAWVPDPERSLILLQVIWMIGWSMILLALLVHLPPWMVGIIGLALMALHPMLDAEALAAVGAPAWLSVIMVEGGRTLALGSGDALIVSYSILPWAGVMAAGFGLGSLLFAGGTPWAPRVMVLGAGLLLAFLVLRATNVGGDPDPWAMHPDLATTAMSFLNTEKYPPSPLYLLMTLGPALMLLAAFALFEGPGIRLVLEPLGQAPLFYYVLHLYVLRAVGLAMAALVWGPDQLGPPPLHSTPEWPLPAVWAVWLVAMAVLFLPTRWFARLKARQRRGWMTYF